MRLVSTREATKLTELSTEQLREWTTRRALIPADVQSRGRGSPAQYAWQTILIIRIALALRDRFHIELHHHRPVFAALRELLAKTSFIGLWGCSLAIYDGDGWELLAVGETPSKRSQAIVVPLDPHLAVLSHGFLLPGPAAEGQLDLFYLAAIDGPGGALTAPDAAVSEDVAPVPARRRA